LFDIQNGDISEKTEEKINKFEIHDRDIKPPRGSVIIQPICTKPGKFVDLINVVMPAQFDSQIYNDFVRPKGGQSHLSL